MAESNTIVSMGDEFAYVNLLRIMIGTFGAVSNVLLLVAFIKDPLKCFRNSGTYLVMNLSVSDCITSLLCGLLFEIARGTFLYPILGFFFFWIAGVSFVSITSISIDRFLMVAYPIKHRILVKGKIMILWISGTWITNFAASIFILFSDIRDSRNRQVLCTCCMILVIISAVMYSSTYYKLKKQSRNLALQNSTENRAQEIRILKEKRFLKTIIIIACVAFVCTVPCLLLFLFYEYQSSALKVPYTICISMFLSNFAVNPLIYIIRLPNYRKTFYLLYCRRTAAS